MSNHADPLDLMVSIVTRDHGEQLSRLYPQDRIPLQMIVQGGGTAKSELLHMLGLEQTEKDIVFSMIPHSATRSILNRAAKLLHMNRIGGGVTFALPLTSVTRLAMRASADPETLIPDIEKEKTMETEGRFELIMCVVHHGYSDKVMDRAREAGATGGTVFHSRALGSLESQKFIKITIQPEKENILILVPADKRAQIMKAITDMEDFITGAQGMIVSIPVTGVAGMGSSPNAD
jgi:hypothetical protein